MASKILETIRKWAWLILAVFALVTVVLVIRNIRIAGAYAEAKATFEKELAAREAAITQALDQKAHWQEKAVQLLAEADAQAKQTAEIEFQLEKKRQEAEALKAKIAAMPADEVVIQTRQRLGVIESEVYKTGLGIQFTLMAAKVNLARLYDADFSLVKDQEFTKIIDGQKAEIVTLRDTITAQGQALQACDVAIAQYKAIELSYADILKKSEKQAKWLKVTVGGVGVAVVGTGLYFLLAK